MPDNTQAATGDEKQAVTITATGDEEQAVTITATGDTGENDD